MNSSLPKSEMKFAIIFLLMIPVFLISNYVYAYILNDIIKLFQIPYLSELNSVSIYGIIFIVGMIRFYLKQDKYTSNELNLRFVVATATEKIIPSQYLKRFLSRVGTFLSYWGSAYIMHWAIHKFFIN